MAKKEREEVELAFNLELETRKAVRGLAVIEKVLRKTASRKVSLELDKKSFSSFKKGTQEYKKEIDSISKVIKDVGGAKNFKKATANLDKLQAAHSVFEKTLREESLKMGKAKQTFKEKMAKADNALVKETLEKQFKTEQKAFRRRLGAAKKNVTRERRDMAKNLSGGVSSLIFEKHTEMAEKQRKGAESREQGLSEMKTAEVGRELGESFGDSVQALAGKDLLGFAKGGMKISASMLRGAGKYGMLVGRNMQIKGAGMGGAGGAAMSGVGKMLGSIGPLVQTLSKLGPILGMAAGAFGSIFKLILDIEAAGKEMNKKILEGASISETFAANGSKAKFAYDGLASTLESIRDDATSMENVEWGLKAEDIISTTNALAQQGVSLESMRKAFANAGGSADASTRQIKGFGDMARMSFAYSKLMGISMQEITDMQGEMFTEMGQNLGGIQLQFARMTKDATESGIASNKFFSMLRGVSSDLGLYTTRIEQAASMLKLLGKSMNPREAQKFLAFTAQGFKQMSEEDRMRMVYMVGEKKVREIVSKDLESKTLKYYADLARASHMTVDEVTKAVKAGGADLEKVFSRVEAVGGAEQVGGLRDAGLQLGLNKASLKKGGVVGVADAAADSSMGAFVDLTRAMLEKNAGGTSLEKMTGLQLYAAKKASNVSREQFRQLIAVKQAVDRQRTTLVETLKTGSATEKKKLAELGLTTEESIAKASTQDVLESMSSADQKALADAADQKDYAKMSTEQTTTLLDKMDIIKDGIFNYLFKALKDIIAIAHSILRIIGKSTVSGSLEDARTKGNSDLIDKLKDVTNGQEGPAARQTMLLAVDKAISKVFASADENATGASGEAHFDLVMKSAMADLAKLFPKGFSERLTSVSQVTGVSDEKKSSISKALGDGKSFEDALAGANLSKSEMQAMVKQALWLQSKEDAGNAAYNVSGLSLASRGAEYMGGVPGTPSAVPGNTAPSAEQAERAAARNTGTVPTPEGTVPMVPMAPVVTSAPTIGVTAPVVNDPVTADLLDIQGRENVQSLQNLYDALRRRGIVIDKSQLSGPIKDTIRLGTLDAFREALFEQSVYSSPDSTALLQRMKESGFSGVSSMATKYEEAKDLKGNASGGTVVGVANGRAVIAARGEGLASVGKGEKIVPAGGGNGNITVNVNGIGGADLANHLKKKIAEGIYEYKRREKFQ
jgi:hypothetical protein